MKKKVSGWLMSKDVSVAEIIDNELMPRREELMPLHFSMGHGSLEDWLKTRAVDVKRVNSRLLRRALKLSDAEQEELARAVNAATITDTYWIKESGSTPSYDSVRFTENQYADIALLGSFTDYGKHSHITPELTNTGSFEKCWKQHDGAWWLYKLGDADNLFSEMAAYRLAQQLGYQVATYELVDPAAHEFVGKLKAGKGIIRTKDFTSGATVNYEPAVGLGLKTDDIIFNHDLLKGISPQLANQYLDILAMDVLVYNLDRHTQNFGVLRDVDSGAILSLAPNFDNNLSLLTGIHGMRERSQTTDELYREWKLLVQGRLIVKPLPAMSRKELHAVLYSINCGVANKDKLVAEDFIWQGYQLMRETMESLDRFQMIADKRGIQIL